MSAFGLGEPLEPRFSGSGPSGQKRSCRFAIVYVRLQFFFLCPMSPRKMGILTVEAGPCALGN